MQNAVVQLTDHHILGRSSDIVERKIHSTYFLVDITDNYSDDQCALYEINDIGSFIWNCIDGHRSIWDIAVELQNVITDEVDLQILIDDIYEFMEALLLKSFVEV